MKKVLLLSEDATASAALACMLSNKGFQLIPVNNEASAQAALASGMPLDLALASTSKKTSKTFLSHLRENRPRLPVIFLTQGSEEDARLGEPGCGAEPLPVIPQVYNYRWPMLLRELDRLVRIALNASAVLAVRGQDAVK